MKILTKKEKLEKRKNELIKTLKTEKNIIVRNIYKTTLIEHKK